MDTRMWNGLVGVAKETYTASLAERVVPRPLMMPLVRGELVGLVWVRTLKAGQDALTGIAELANIAAALPSCWSMRRRGWHTCRTRRARWPTPLGSFVWIMGCCCAGSC
ncbi:hypothetical protein [Streptomyces sp. NPDC002640]